MRWMLLPLPPQVRDDDATWEEARYYIHDSPQDAASSLGVWEVTRYSYARRSKTKGV